MNQAVMNPSSIVVGASLAGPSEGLPVEARESVDALRVVVDVAPAAAVRWAVTFASSFRAHVPIALAALQLAWVFLKSARVIVLQMK